MIKRTLYFGNPVYLSTRNEQLVITLPEIEQIDNQSNIKTIAIEDIGIIIIDHQQITLSHSLLQKLLKNNCAVISCDNSHLPVGLLLPLIGNSVQQERFHVQIRASLPLKKQLWQQTVKAKIINQAILLQNSRQIDVKNMELWASQVTSGDSQNHEARAAAFYWNNLFADNKFRRGRDELPPNNLLNYGYAILRAVVARALVATGLLPTFGIHHHNRYNAYCLADDIMEPYRPFVDKIVLEIVQSKQPYEIITKNIKQQLLVIPTLDVIIKGRRSPLMNAVGITTASLYDCFEKNLRKIYYPEFP